MLTIKNIVLASQSPRRKEILDKLNISFDIIPSNFDESSYINSNPITFVETLAFEKAKDVASKLTSNYIVIGCDTVVVYNHVIIGKPSNKQHAYDLLKTLVGKKHMVYSGIAIIDNENNVSHVDHGVTEVYMRNINDYEISAYIQTGEPLDKAGAYGIQGIGALLVEKIVGDYYNVMGLPINQLYKGLDKIGIKLFDIVKK